MVRIDKTNMTDEQARQATRDGFFEQMVALGVPSDEANIVIDVSMHAAEQAMEKLIEVVLGAGDLSMTSAHLAYQLIISHATSAAADVKAQLDAEPGVITGNILA